VARYDFASDNVAGAMPEVMDALIAANAGTASGYGTDHISRIPYQPDGRRPDPRRA